MYNVVISPAATSVLVGFAAKCAIDNGEECACHVVDSFNQAVLSLEEMPERATRKLPALPSKYRILPFWKHLWLVFQISKKENTVYIDYVIDDRSEYKKLFEL